MRGKTEPRKNRKSSQAPDPKSIRKMLDILPHPILVVDLQGKITDANTFAARLFGFTVPRDLKGKNLGMFSAPGEGCPIQDWQKLVPIEQAHPIPITWRIRKPTGEVLSLEVLIQKIPKRTLKALLVVLVDRTQQQRLQDSLIESIAVYRSLVEQIPAGFFRKDLEGKYVYVNDWFCNLRGLKPQQILGKRPTDFISESEDLDPKIKNLLLQGEEDHKKIIQSGCWITREEEYPEVPGRPQWLLSVKTPVYDPKGNIIGSQGLVLDITDSKRIESTLRRQQIFLSTLLDALPVIVFAKDTQGKYILTNRAHQAILGASAEEILGKTGFDFHPPELAAEYQKEEEAIISTGKARPIKEELAFNHALGQYRWHLTTRVPIKDEQGNICGVLGIGLDITDRKKAEEALQQSELRYRTLIDNLANIVLLYDMTGRIIDLNRRAIELLGYSREELLQLNVKDLDTASRLTPTEDLWKKTSKGITPILETNFPSKSGNLLPMEFELSGLETPTDRLFIALGRDISQRKKAEELRIKQLERRRAMYEILHKLAASPDLQEGNIPEFARQLTELVAQKLEIERVGVWLFNEDNTALTNLDTYILSTGEHTSGETLLESEFRPEFEALKSSIYIDAHDAFKDPRVAGYVEGYLRKHGITSMLDVGIKIHGRTVGVLCLEHVGPPRRWQEEEIDFACQLADQIAMAFLYRQRRLDELTLRENEARFRILVEHSNDIIAIINAEGIIRYFCPSTTRILGYEASEILGKSVFQIIHPDDHEKALKGIKELLERPEQTVRVQTRVRHKNGDWRIMDTVARLVPGKTPEPLIVFNTRDVTEQVKLEQHLSQAAKMEAIGHLAGGIAHDFNNILAIILMQSELGSQIEGLSQEAYEAFSQIRAAATRAAELTRKLLILSRREVLQPTTFDLNDCVRSLTSLLTRTVGEHIQLKTHLAPTPLPIYGDCPMIETVILNLVVNARDAMPQGGELIISTESAVINDPAYILNPKARPGRYAVLSVKDTGHGIPEEIMPRIFEPFFTTKPHGKGTGLGLSTVYGIVQQHHGWVTVTSAVGKGSTFSVYIPLAESALPQPQTPTEEESPQGKAETILLVEDNPSVRRLTRLTLERAGYRVIEASNANEALQLWETHKHQINLLFTDIILPGGMNGHQLAARLHEYAPDLPVVYTSGYAEDLAGQQLELKKTEAFIQKPASPTKILKTIKACLDAAKNK